MSKAYYVSPDGSDQHPGTFEEPFQSIGTAKMAVRRCEERGTQPILVYLMGGTFYLDCAIQFLPEDSGGAEAPVTYCAYNDAAVIISGGVKLALAWKLFQGWQSTGEDPGRSGT